MPNCSVAVAASCDRVEFERQATFASQLPILKSAPTF